MRGVEPGAPLKRAVAESTVPIGSLPRVTPGHKLVALFGGSFDPVTRSHGDRIRQLAMHHQQDVITLDGSREKRRFDEVWVIPVFQHFFAEKREHMAPFNDRVQMLALELHDVLGAKRAGKAAVNVCTIEARLGGVSRTFDTVAALRARYPRVDFVLCLGADIKNDVGKWYRFDDLQRTIGVQFCARAGYEGGEKDAIAKMSSTDLREAIVAGDQQAIARMASSRVQAHLARRSDLRERYRMRAESERRARV